MHATHTACQSNRQLPPYFYTQFKQVMKMSPTTYRIKPLNR